VDERNQKVKKPKRNNMILYLVKASLCLSAFWLAYGTLLRPYTFFSLNRYFLLLGIVASFVIPHTTTPEYSQKYNVSAIGSLESSWIGATPVIDSGNALEEKGPEINYVMLVCFVYLAGVAILLGRLLLSIASHLRIIVDQAISHKNGIRVVQSNQRQAYTFFGIVFLPGHALHPAIFAHEMVHVRQRHWIDLLLIELTCAVLWFNPVVFLYRRAVRLQHEYLADSLTVEGGVAVEHYLHCLMNQLKVENSFTLTNKFHSHPIKDRIFMLTRNKTSGKFKAVYVLLIPALFSLLTGFLSKSASLDTADTTGSSQSVNAAPPATVGESKPSVAPVDMAKAKVSAVFGERIHPVTGKRQLHTGIDFELAEGEIVMATARGIVKTSRFDSLRGNYVVIIHGEEYVTSYFHLKSMSVKPGDPVELGQKIGFVGSTGKLSIRPHLHYEVIKHGKPVDPEGYLSGQ
jgi:hypothetical protein